MSGKKGGLILTKDQADKIDAFQDVALESAADLEGVSVLLDAFSQVRNHENREMEVVHRFLSNALKRISSGLYDYPNLPERSNEGDDV